MDRTPVSLAIPLLLRVGPFARPLALLGAAAVSLGVGGMLGVIYPYTGVPLRGAGRSPSEAIPWRPWVRVLVSVAGMVTYVVVLFPNASPVVAGVEIVVYLLGLHLFGRPIEHSPSRRDFLLHSARVLSGIGALVALLYVGPLVDQFRANAAGRQLFAWRPRGPRKPGFAIPGLSPEVTPQSRFYVMDEDLQDPDLAVEGWTVSVGGLLQRPYSFSFADLLAMQRRDEIVTQECVSNPVGGPLMSTALFSGVSLAALLRRGGGVMPGGTAVLVRGSDGHEEALPLRIALDPAVMLVYACNGQLLTVQHGFPARFLLPGMYGYKSVKWVESIRVTTNPAEGYWEREGWKALPEVHTVARIDVARPVAAGVLVAGVAFAGRRGIRAVQVRANEDAWHEAVLHTPALSPYSWIQWRATLPVRGGIRLEARAIDGTGRIQTATEHGQKPNGATGYHSVHVTV